MNPEHITPVKCDLCGEPLGINNMYPGCLCEHCFWATSLISRGYAFLMLNHSFNASSIRDAVAEDSKRFSDKYCCSIRDINKEEENEKQRETVEHGDL